MDFLAIELEGEEGVFVVGADFAAVGLAEPVELRGSDFAVEVIHGDLGLADANERIRIRCNSFRVGRFFDGYPG